MNVRTEEAVVEAEKPEVVSGGPCKFIFRDLLLTDAAFPNLRPLDLPVVRISEATGLQTPLLVGQTQKELIRYLL
jgi:hypothetical protein